MTTMHRGSIAAESVGGGARGAGPARAGQPDVVLLHPDLGPGALRLYLQSLWGEQDRSLPPPGYRDASFAFQGLRVFCREECAGVDVTPDASLLPRVMAWVDERARDWRLPSVLAVQELDFWDFLRDDFVSWLHARLVERRFIEDLVARGHGAVIAVGLDAGQRQMLRRLVEVHAGRLRVEMAHPGPPRAVGRETVTERRARKLFFLVQDIWHGFRLLGEGLVDRRPKVLLVSSARCWQRSLLSSGRAERTDIHLQEIWRAGRRRAARLYYRSDSYHPDVGAMTAGRLAPLYLQLGLFLLAQTSRGFLEVRRVQRQWRELEQRPDFRAAWVWEGLALESLVVPWLDRAVGGRLPRYAREARRERHFLKGMRPAALVLSLERDANRPLLAAARQLGIPAVGVQAQPLSPDVFTRSVEAARRESVQHLPDRLCVFSAETKRRLVEQGGIDPSLIAVVGDPRVGASAQPSGPPVETLRALRSGWGAEESQRVIAVVGRPEETPELLAALSAPLAGREDVLVVLAPTGVGRLDETRGRQLAARRGLRWVHFSRSAPAAEWLAAVDLLITTRWTVAAEAVRFATPAILVRWDGTLPADDPLPADLARPAGSTDALRAEVEAHLARPPQRLADDAVRRVFLAAVYGEAPEEAPGRIMDEVERLVRGSR